jgi:hypothetical protein
MEAQLLMSLEALLLSTLFWLSPRSREVVVLLVTFGAMGADSLAKRLGLTSRYQLGRILAHDGLPPLQELKSWIRVVGWVLEWEQRGTSLCRSALSRDIDPAVCYRRVKELTGSSWTEVRRRGLAWSLLQLRDRCRPPADVLARAGRTARQSPIRLTGIVSV